MHKVNTLIDAFVTTVTGLTTTGQNVEQSRGFPTAQYPAITVRLASIDPQREISNAFLDSFVEIETIYHVAGDTLDADLLQVDAEVYAAIMADRTFGGAVTDTDPRDLVIETSADKEIPTANGVRRWRCLLRHSITDAET